MGLHPTTSFPRAHPGPSGNDPLTDDELAFLMAIPRAAESTPDAILFRLPLGLSPSMGWIDVTCAEVRSIVASLAVTWRARLSEILCHLANPISGCPVGQGTTICILAEPDFHGVFHLLAFWALGCTVQFVSTADPRILDAQLNRSGCKVLICSGFNHSWIEERKKNFDGAIVQLTEAEQAHRLAQSEKRKPVDVPLPWPVPQRPIPALILQSTGTTGMPKLLRLSLHFHTFGHAYNCQTHLTTIPGQTHKTPYTHPRLLLAPFYRQNFYRTLFVHLTTATPVAFAHYTNILEFSSSQLIDWATTLDVGGIACDAGQICQMPRSTLETHSGFFRSLYSFTLSGAAINSSLSRLCEELDIRFTNIYGMSELGRLLSCSEAPYTHLRPFPDMPPPLVRPISDFGPDGSRHVELWFSAATFPPLAHHHAYGGVPLKLEPFPGDGPHRGELAINLGDVFQEVTIKAESNVRAEAAYIHAGRYSDQIRLSGTWCDDMNASMYESQLMSEINTRINQAGDHPWTVSAIQLFGTNMPCTALIVQLRGSKQGSPGICGSEGPSDSLIQQISDAVEKVNLDLDLPRGLRVHSRKRMLVVSSDGAFTHGPGIERLAGLSASLSLTHKRTAKRWDSVCKFKPWLDGLDFSEP